MPCGVLDGAARSFTLSIESCWVVDGSGLLAFSFYCFSEGMVITAAAACSEWL